MTTATSHYMASADDRRRSRHHYHRHLYHLSWLLHSASSCHSSIIISNSPPPSAKVPLPLLLPEFSLFYSLLLSDSTLPNSRSSIQSSSVSSMNNRRWQESSPAFPSTGRISAGKGRGPAFVGQVFSMCDLSGTGLMAVSNHLDIPFLSKRTPDWLKKMLAAVTKGERKNGPVFRLFMDLRDAVSYVKRLNIPSGVVGACRLDIAYKHFKERPHLFQFIPNEKQVKEANKLLKTMPHGDGRNKVEGVPVFSAENLEIAVATEDAIKRYTPYFFDKNVLDNILEKSVDQHFHALIQTRHSQRCWDILDDLSSEGVEDTADDTMFEPSEVEEMMDDIGHPAIPLSVISKAAEVQLLHAVDRVLLGNKWLRKAIGVQPKFPYVVDSFEKKSAASFLRANTSSSFIADSDFRGDATQSLGSSEVERKDNICDKQGQMLDLRLPFGDWSSQPRLDGQPREKNIADKRDVNSTGEHRRQVPQSSPFLPKITIVGVSTGEAVQLLNDDALKKTILNVKKELEQLEKGNSSDSGNDQFNFEDRDPLFVANIGDYISGISKTASPRLGVVVTIRFTCEENIHSKGI